MEDEDDSFTADGTPINFSGDDSLPDYATAAGFELPGSVITADSNISPGVFNTGLSGGNVDGGGDGGTSGGITINNGTSTGTSSTTSALSSIGNSIGSIFKSLTGGNTGAVSQPGAAASTAGTQIQQTASSITSAVTSFLPLIFLGLVVWLVIGIFARHRR